MAIQTNIQLKQISANDTCETIFQKQKVKFKEEEENLGNKKVQVKLEQVL